MEGCVKKERKPVEKENKDLTGPALLEMDVKPRNRRELKWGSFADQAISDFSGAKASEGLCGIAGSSVRLSGWPAFPAPHNIGRHRRKLVADHISY